MRRPKAVAAISPRTQALVTIGCCLLVAPPLLALTPDAVTQIEILLDEKASRSPAARKIDSQLLLETGIRRGDPMLAALPQLQTAVEIAEDGMILLDIRASVSPALLAYIRGLGGEIVNAHANYRAIRARLPMERLETLAARADVHGIRPADEATRSKLDTNEGDIAHRAIDARVASGRNGSSVSVCVLSDSVDFLADVQASGDLPFVDVLPGQSGVAEANTSGEGTAMLEIVHDLVPGAALGFATAWTGQAQFAANILGLRDAGCNVIVDDIIYFREPAFQDGVIAQAIDEVSAGGVFYFSSAGNAGNLNDGTSSVWEGDFVDSGARLVVGGSQLWGTSHDFANSKTSNALASSTSVVTLQWADPYGASSNDFDLCLLNAALTTVYTCSTNWQNGDDDPYEQLGPAYAGERLVIIHYSSDGAPRMLRLNAHGGRLEFATDGQVYGHAAASSAFAVAAVDVTTASGGAFSGGASNPVEPYSADGPRRVFFADDGSPLTIGNFSASGGELRAKPEATAADNVSTATPGFESFRGTSAAAPQLAGLVALALDVDSTLSPALLRSVLGAASLDIEAPGADRDSGSGIVDAIFLLDSLVTPGPTNDPPVLDPVAMQTVSEGAVLSVALSAVDPDGDTVTLSVSDMPPFCVFADNGDGSGEMSCMPGFGAAGDYVLTATASDAALVATQSFVLRVLAANRAPQFAASVDRFVVEQTSASFTVMASDADGDTLALTLGAAPGFCLLTDHGDGSATLDCTPDSGDAGAYPVEVTASDGVDPVTATFNVQVLPSARPEIGNDAAQFSASDAVRDYIDVVADVTTVPPLAPSGAMTVSAWVLPTAAPDGSGRMIIGDYRWNGAQELQRGWRLGDAYGADDHISFSVHDATGRSTSVADDGFFARNLGRWVHVAGVFVPGESLVLYIDGREAARRDGADVIAAIAHAPATPLRIGARADFAANGRWDGAIDEVVLHTRALSALEVFDLASNGPRADPALRLYYPFDDGVAADLSGNGYHGTVRGDVLSGGGYVATPAGQSLTFTGTDTVRESIDVVPDASSVPALAATGAMTVSAWVLPTAAPDGTGRVIIGDYRWNGAASLQRGWSLGDAYGNADHIAFAVHDATGRASSVTDAGFFARHLGRWVHVAGVFVPGQSLALYVDGREVARKTGANVIAAVAHAPATPLRIGARADNAAHGRWDGSIDEVSLYGRALGAPELRRLARNGPSADPALRLYYPFNDGEAADLSGNAHDGLLRGDVVAGAGHVAALARQALGFTAADPVREFIDVVADASTVPALAPVGAMTVSAWVLPTTAPDGTGRVVIGNYRWNGDLTLQRGWSLGDAFGSKDHLVFAVHDATGRATSVTDVGFFASHVGRWVHIAGVFVPGQSLVLYVDGREVARRDGTDVVAAIAHAPATPLRIGARADNAADGRWDGLIDELTLHTRALAALEIRRLADDGPGDDSALSLYYPFDEGAPTDLSGNGHDGVLHGELVVIDLP